MLRLAFPALAITCVVALAACGGGGGSTGGPPPTQATTMPIVLPGGGNGTPKPQTSPPPAGPNATNVNVQSVPAGLAVTIANGSTSQSATTPTTTQPAVSNFATLISIAPSNGAPAYTYAVDQHGAGAKTFLYNQAADTNGSIAQISTSSGARSVSLAQTRSLNAASSAAAANLPRRFSRGALDRPRESATRVVVRYRASALAAGRGMRAVEAAQGVTRGTDIGPQTGAILTRVIEVPAGKTSRDVAASLRANPEVADARPERLYYTENAPPVMTSDTHFSNYDQWSMFATGAVNAWGYGTGNPSVSIAVIDTGADFTHRDLAGGKIVYAESVLNGTVNTGTNPATGTNYAQDTDGHGTNVAGIAAANTDNMFGYAGMGFNSSLQVYKVFADGTKANMYSSSANSGDVTKAIYDAVAHGARVINLSLGTCQVEGADPMQRDAVAFAIAHNVTVVAAAGNERGGTSSDPNCSGGSSTVDFPAAYDGVIAVGASKYNDTVVPMMFNSLNSEAVASYSNAGPGLTLVAPGGDPTTADMNATTADLLHWVAGLYTTTPADPSPTARCKDVTDCRALFAGTSQAAPHAAGAAALLLAANGNLTPAQIKAALANTADEIGDPSEGAGRLNVYRALAAVRNDAQQPVVPTNANFVAFAYQPNGTAAPAILDVTYTAGVRVASNGTFRIADLPANAPSYKIGVWDDANGDGKVDAGDYFGSSQTCTVAAPCASAAGIVVRPVATGFVLN